MSDRVRFEARNARYIRQNLEDVREASLDGYVVSPPTRTSEGQMPAMFDTLAGTMVELYNQVQELIASSEEMIEKMAEKLVNADEGSAVM